MRSAKVSKITEKRLAQFCFSHNLQEETQRGILSGTGFFPPEVLAALLQQLY